MDLFTQFGRIFRFAVFIAYMLILPCSCAMWDSVFGPNIENEKEDIFFKKTGHQLLKIYVKEDKLGYIFDKGVFIKKAWGGRKIISHTGQDITLVYKRESFDKLKLFLGDDFDIGPHLDVVHYVEVHLNDVYQYQLTDVQPLIEYMGKESLPLLQQDFIASMIKVSRFSVEAYQKVAGEIAAVYRPYQLPMLKVKGSTGTSSSRTEDQVGYNIFVGYQLYNGTQWIQDFEETPKVEIWILNPNNDAIITRVRARIKGSIPNYYKLEEKYKNQLRVYLMTKDEYEDQWILQSKVTIDPDGRFEGIIKLGTLERGDGHRYSIAAFATYFDINREVNSKIPFLPFNKGKYQMYVTRKDEIE